MSVFETIPQGYPLWTLIVKDNELAPALIIGWDVHAAGSALPIFAAGTIESEPARELFAGLFLTEAEALAEKIKVESEEGR